MRALTRLLRWVARPAQVLTPLGRGLLVLGLLLFAASWRLHWQEFTQFGAVVIALVVLAWLWAMLPGAPRTGVDVQPTRMTAGGRPAVARVDVTAGALPLVAPRIEVPVGSTAVGVRVGFLPSRARRTFEVELPDLPRGVHIVGPVTYLQADPLGMVARRLLGEGTATVMVRPRVTDLAVFAGGLTADLEGATSQELSMSDMSFHALREYVKGDDLRHVHWRSSARANKLLVRQYQETRRGHVTVLVDDAETSYPSSDDFELAVSIGSSIAVRLARENFDTYFRCGPSTSQGRRSTEHLDVACRFEMAKDNYLHDAAEAASAVPVTGMVIQVTGTRPSVELYRAARRFDSSAQSLIVRATATAPAAGRSPGRSSRGGREVVVPTLERLRPVMAAGLR